MVSYQKKWQLCLFPKYPDPLKLTILRTKTPLLCCRFIHPSIGGSLVGPQGWIYWTSLSESRATKRCDDNSQVTPSNTHVRIKGVFGTRCLSCWILRFHLEILCPKNCVISSLSGKNWWNPGGSWCGVFTLTKPKCTNWDPQHSNGNDLRQVKTLGASKKWKMQRKSHKKIRHVVQKQSFVWIQCSFWGL